MVSVFFLRDGRLEHLPIRPEDRLPAEEVLSASLWIDLQDPSEDERTWVERRFGLELPEYREMNDIEPSARLYEDEDGLHLHSYFLSDHQEEVRNTTVAFDLLAGRLFTLRRDDLPVFRLFRLRARRQPGLVKEAADILVGLFETKVEHVADELEQIYAELESISRGVLRREKTDLVEALEQLAIQEDLTGKARLALLDTRRDLSYMLRYGVGGASRAGEIKDILRDVESLTSHTSFLFDKVNFLMDAVMGLVNIEQNKIIKIFSIAAVVFLPPTLVASIYGMNFKHLPELDWAWGYPAALALMLLAGIAPYWYFKRKGWL